MPQNQVCFEVGLMSDVVVSNEKELYAFANDPCYDTGGTFFSEMRSERWAFLIKNRPNFIVTCCNIFFISCLDYVLVDHGVFASGSTYISSRKEKACGEEKHSSSSDHPLK